MKKLFALMLALVLALSLVSFASAEEAGKVYYLNFKPEADQAWQELAKIYTEKTGVEVKVFTAASGTYSSTLTTEMGKDGAAPTLFQIGNAEGVATWNNYALPLDGTELMAEMTTEDFNLKNAEGQTVAVGYCYEAYGIIVNKTLLEKAGYTLDDIRDFESLKKVADDIHARSGELGFDAFTSAGLDPSSSWRFSGHLTNMPLFYEFRDDGITETPATVKGTYLNAYKNIWDLYITDSAADPNKLATYTGDSATEEFTSGKAVFFQNGTWMYADLIGAGMKPEELAMLPIYCGVEGEEKAAVCAGTENCWAVNAQASEADQKATLEFLKWVVTSDEGTAMMAEQFGPIPFKAAKETENIFFNDANAQLAEGKYVVTWAFNYTPDVDNWRAGIVSALESYSAGAAGWDEVEYAFTEGWAKAYEATH